MFVLFGYDFNIFLIFFCVDLLGQTADPLYPIGYGLSNSGCNNLNNDPSGDYYSNLNVKATGNYDDNTK